MYSFPPTPSQDCEDPLAYSLSDLSLGFSWMPSPTISSGPPSYDPMSPSYDPSAASPCNPFPTSSPFAAFAFPRAQAPSKLRFEDVAEPETIPEPVVQSAQALAAFSQIPPPHSAPSLRRTKPCRFFLSPAGCKTGRWCNFKHPVGAGGYGEDKSLEALRAAVVRSRKGNVEVSPEPDLSAWDDVPDVRDLDPDWGKKSEGDVHPKYRTQPCRNFLLGICRYGSKCQFIHAPGLYAPALPLTGNAHVLVPPAYPKSLPLPVPVPVNVPSAAPASAPLPVPVSVWGAHPGVGAGVSEGCAKPEQMSLYYRTKPCKYFSNDGACPHGDECKFIHDPKKASPTSEPSFIVCAPPPSMSWADDDREFDFEGTPKFVEDEMDVDSAMHDMTNSSTKKSTPSQRRRERARDKEARDSAPGGIHKAQWRVVGGGVMIGKMERRPRVSRSRLQAEDDDEDAVLEYQPHDPNGAYAQAPFADDSPIEYTAPASPFDYDYTFDPARYPPHELLRSPSPTGALDIAMGQLQEWSTAAPVSVNKKKVVTGAELMAGISGRGECERERERPRLRIAVPAPAAFTQRHRRTQSHSQKGYTPYPRRGVAATTEAGDDVLDWGDEEDEGEGDGEEEEEEGECGEEIRRARSTPPTPRSNASYLDVPIMPRLAAESP